MNQAALTRAINRFETAVDARAFKGSRPPEERPEIDRRYESARAALVRLFENR